MPVTNSTKPKTRGPEAVNTPLGQAFVEDHTHLIRGFAGLKEALERDDLTEAKRLADELDHVGGSHIRFEETILYPRVAESRGRAYTDQLYDEHHVGLDVIRQLRDCPDTGPLESSLRDRMIAGAQVALDHAISCGTLLSHLTSLSSDAQSELLDRLNDLRREATRWTELPEGHNADRVER